MRMPTVRVLVARGFDNGRSFIFGEIIEPVKGHEDETHALALTTPVQRIVHLMNETDAAWLTVIAQLLNNDKPINQRWIDIQIKRARKDS